MAGSTQKFNSLRRQRELEHSWDDMSSLGKIYVSSIMNDPNVESIIESMKKLFGDGRNRNSETMQQLLAFTIFYSSSIYAMLLCFLYWKWHNDANAEQPEDADAPADTE